jgi:hypothetical protein
MIVIPVGIVLLAWLDWRDTRKRKAPITISLGQLLTLMLLSYFLGAICGFGINFSRL